MHVVAGRASRRLGAELARRLGARHAEADTKDFPDGEVYVRVPARLDGEDVVLVQTTYPNASLIELILLQAAVRERGARHVTVVIPYYAYSRQDVAFQDGEVVSAKVIAETIGARADRVITVDPHKDHILRFFTPHAVAATAVPEIAEHFREHKVDLVLAPDKGALDRARQAADALGAPSDFLEKTRISGTEVRMAPKSLDVRDKTVAIIDDIISTGGTIATAAGELKRQGARKVIAACTHGLFLNDAATRLGMAGCDDVLATDTIDGPASRVTAAPAIARALRDHA